MTDPTQVDTRIDDIMADTRIPLATYRVQFHPEHMTFEDALVIVPYLHALGISDLYASPLFKPRKGSTHGYDTVDYNQFNPRLGDDTDFQALSEALRRHDMSILLDIVPNHMGASTENDWWQDVLKHGPASIYAHYFDIDWRPVNRALDDKVLLPVLGDHYGRVLEAGELELVYWHGDFYLHYYEHQFPLTPETYVDILRPVHAELTQLEHDEPDEPVEQELLSIITALDFLPPYRTRDEDALIMRRREQRVIRRRLLHLWETVESFQQAVTAALDTLNGNADDPASFDTLDDILNRQPYRLSYWRVAADEINYRRFFDINDMAAMRIEEPDVFLDTHRLTLRLLAEGHVTGLRVDHSDGLWNPRAYFLQLQQEYIFSRLEADTGNDYRDQAIVRDRLEALAQRHPGEAAPWPLYIVTEKILSETEPLPYTWAVYGTTGYDFMTAAGSLLVNPKHEEAFDEVYADFIGRKIDFEALTDRTKKLIMDESLTSEIDARSAELARLVEENRRYRGFTRNSIAFAMKEFIAALPIYRTYISGPASVSDRDRYYIDNAIDQAKARNPLTPESVFDFLRDTLLMANIRDFAEHRRPDLREFVQKFQQITGPVMAKSVEDTAFYIYNRLVALNEVGGHPEQFGMTTDLFHRQHERHDFNRAMVSTSTHDTKRSEDVRARLAVLSEMPGLWRDKLHDWADLNASAKTRVQGEPAPSRNDEYLLYQTLLGAYQPSDADDLTTFERRIVRYMKKALNEAKVHSNWVNPNPAYQQATADFVRDMLHNEAFMQSFEPFQQRLSFFGRINSLTQTLLKLTVPGVPDMYQGNELWDYSLVDPDNRRPVDYAERQQLLTQIQEQEAADRLQLARDLTDDMDSGAIKLYITYRALHLRRKMPELFLDGAYIPVEAEGEKSAYVCAFLRQTDEAAVLVIVPRLPFGLLDGETRLPTGNSAWRDTHLVLPEHLDVNTLENLFSGERFALESHLRVPVRLADALDVFPVGLLRLHA